MNAMNENLIWFQKYKQSFNTVYKHCIKLDNIWLMSNQNKKEQKYNQSIGIELEQKKMTI